MATESSKWFCRASGVSVTLEWDILNGKAINRSCSVQSACARYLKPAQAPQTLNDYPIAACGLLAQDSPGRWISLDQHKPTAKDADTLGDVLFLRAGMEMLGRLKSGIPVDATHWRPTGRK